MQKISFLFSLLLPACVLASGSDSLSVRFDYAKYDLTSTTLAALDSLAATNDERPILRIELSGHTDSDGTIEYNDELSRNRVNAVRDYLVSKGVEVEVLASGYHGELQPIATNGDERGKGMNRRVDIKVVRGTSAREMFAPETKVLTVKDPSTSCVLEVPGRKTRIYVPTNAFVYRDGSLVDRAVTIEFTEYANSADMVFSGIPMTYTEGEEKQFFSSSGMFKISGHAGEEEVEIAPGKSLTVDYELTYQNPEISFFELDEQSGNWTKQKDIEPLVRNERRERAEETPEHLFFHEGAKLRRRRHWFFDGYTIRVKRTRRSYEVRPDDAVAIISQFNQNVDGLFGNYLQVDSGVYSYQPPVNPKMDGTLLGSGMDAGHTYPDIVRGLNVGNFGVYNCDQIYRLENRVNIVANYVDENGSDIKDGHVLAMVDLDYNGSFSWEPGNFSCNAKANNVLLLFTKKGKIYVLDKGRFQEKGIVSSGKHTFTMRDATSEFTDSASLANYLEI